MEHEYDFTKAQRGKFYRTNAEIRLPVYLDKEAEKYFVERAEKRITSSDEPVNRVAEEGESKHSEPL